MTDEAVPAKADPNPKVNAKGRKLWPKMVYRPIKGQPGKTESKLCADQAEEKAFLGGKSDW